MKTQKRKPVLNKKERALVAADKRIDAIKSLRARVPGLSLADANRVTREYQAKLDDEKHGNVVQRVVQALAPFQEPEVRIAVLRRIDQHAGKPPIADVSDPFAHVEIWIGGRRYILDAKNGALEVRMAEHTLLVEPIASNTILVHGKERG